MLVVPSMAFAQQPLVPPTSTPDAPAPKATNAPAVTNAVAPRDDGAGVPGAPANRPAEAATNAESQPAPAASISKPKVSREANAYIIGEQDVLNVNVWKEPDLTGPVTVRPDGKITLPLLNDIYVVGMTTDELQELLTEKLKPFVNVPQVTVSPREVNSRKVYTIGQVAREGTFKLNGSMTVLQLIAEAGGLRDFAKRKKIYVMRTENGKHVRFSFNYDEVIQGKNIKQDIQLQPGDTVVVP